MSKDGTVPQCAIDAWTQYQFDVAERAIFDDPQDQTFTVNVSLTSGIPGTSATDPTAHDWDDPSASYLDPATINVRGLRRVAGVDISYRVAGDNNDAVVCLVVLDFPSMQPKYTFLKPIKITQPYIPSFLAMRELAHVCSIYDEAVTVLAEEDKPQLVLIDGFGRWHQRQAGLATAFGVERNIPTIGVGKEYQIILQWKQQQYL